jgi:dihydrofolate synthase/folylpolyglutamate synthase
VVSPECCVVTNIGFDHTDKLGDTAEEIALEKAGIFKDGVPVVISRQQYPDALGALRGAAEARGCSYYLVGEDITVDDASPMAAPPDDPDAPVGWRFRLSTPQRTYEDVRTPLLGRHQLDNLAAAVGAVEVAAERAREEMEWDEVAPAISRYEIEGRMEVLQRSPAVILDVAHTVESIDALLKALETHFPERALHVVFGCSAGKKVRGMLHRLRRRCVSLTLTQAQNPRAMAADELERTARAIDLKPPEGLSVIADSRDALESALAKAEPADVVCVTGSFFTAGEIRERWLETHADHAPQSSSSSE